MTLPPKAINALVDIKRERILIETAKKLLDGSWVVPAKP